MRATLLFLALTASVLAATISIDIGKEGTLKFDPNSTTAAIKDTWVPAVNTSSSQKLITVG